MDAEISIIVPVYQMEKYLCKCVDSILSQVFADFELILVDDGSTDNSPVICDKYAQKDCRVRVIHRQNGGVSAARNAALDAAIGKYVVFCDADDYWKRGWLGSLHTAITGGHVDVVSANFVRVDDSGAFLSKKAREVNDFTFPEWQTKIEFLVLKVLCGTLGWEVTTRIFRGDIIRKNHLRFCESCGNFAEDLGFVLEYMLYCSTAKSIDEDGYCYVQREDSMMHKSTETIKLDSMNEISRQVGNRYFSLIEDSFKKKYPILHFLIMNCQYCKIVSTPNYPHLDAEINKIQDKTWYFRQTKNLFLCYPQLKRLLGKDFSRRMLLLSNYCLHRNWKRFQVESALYYRVVSKSLESNYCN